MDPNDQSTTAHNLNDIREMVRILGRQNADTLDAFFAEAEANAKRESDRIRADTSRTEEWRRANLAKAYASTVATLARKLTAAGASVVKQDTDDAGRVFGVQGLPGDYAALTMSRRDAVDRVATITDPETRGKLTAAALRSGDETLSRALVEQAMEYRDTATVNMFAAARPQLTDAVERLWAATDTRPSTLTLVQGWRIDALVGAFGLADLMWYEIDALAAQVNSNA